MQEAWVWTLGWDNPLEKEMATNSSILAWRTPWTEESGRLQSMGSQRVGHNWAAFTCLLQQLCLISSLPLLCSAHSSLWLLVPSVGSSFPLSVDESLPSGESSREPWWDYSLDSCTLEWFHLAGSQFPETLEGTPELLCLQARGDLAGLFSFQPFLWATEEEVLSEHSHQLSCLAPGVHPFCFGLGCPRDFGSSELTLAFLLLLSGLSFNPASLSPSSSAGPEVSLIVDSRPHLCAGLSDCQAHDSSLQLAGLALRETTPTVSRGMFKTIVSNCFNSWIFSSEFSETFPAHGFKI